MKVAQINMVSNGSTGTIMLQIGDIVKKHGGEVITYSTYAVGKQYQRPPAAPTGHTYYGSPFGNLLHLILAQFTGKNGFFSRFSTWKLLKDLARFSPDIVHLHNLHSAYLNLPMLFGWLKKHNVQVVWTFHDCWPMTAKCPYFDMCGCEKWLTGCHDCEQLALYPKVRVDRTAWLWKKRKALFTSLNRLTIVTPSKWLAEQVKRSYFSKTKLCVIPNGIDLQVFHPMESTFRKEYHCEDKFILLGVANPFCRRKGLDVFIELAGRLEASYQIVLVGTSEEIDKTLPSGIISIHRTENARKLAEIYSAADLFVNPTREETFGLVNVEALACGTPVLTFRTGGSPETVDEKSGWVVDCDDVDAMEAAINDIRYHRRFSKADCIARAKNFDKEAKFFEYYSLYCALTKGEGNR